MVPNKFMSNSTIQSPAMATENSCSLPTYERSTVGHRYYVLHPNILFSDIIPFDPQLPLREAIYPLSSLLLVRLLPRGKKARFYR